MKYVEHYALFGIPCSGKGEHSKIINGFSNNDLQIIEMGAEFRKEIYSATMLGQIIAPDVWAGNLLPDHYATHIVNRYSLAQNTLFDGYPRTLAQAREYHKRIKSLRKRHGYEVRPMAIFIDTKEETAVARMKNRIATANRKGIPVRADDVEEVLRHRIKLANTVTAQAMDYLDSKGVPVLVVDGQTDILGDDKNLYTQRVDEIQDFVSHVRDSR
ncbi:MAG: nucleoside monophosphate kinase [Rickettsiales bacterium]|jgi:adenylate kinase family enzyme|nr:nucleoside monophosphate kinase [Rickettsiales bacterium]